MSAYAVGDRVIVVGSGRILRQERVVKVGRTLVHVSTPWGDRTEAYRMDTGVVNDNYGHRRIYTEAAYREQQDLELAIRRLTDHGVTLSVGLRHRISSAALGLIADILDREARR